MTTPQEYYAKAEAALNVASTIQGEHLDDEISAHDMVQYVRAMESARLLLGFAQTGAELARLELAQRGHFTGTAAAGYL